MVFPVRKNKHGYGREWFLQRPDNIYIPRYGDSGVIYLNGRIVCIARGEIPETDMHGNESAFPPTVICRNGVPHHTQETLADDVAVVVEPCESESEIWASHNIKSIIGDNFGIATNIYKPSFFNVFYKNTKL